MPSERVPDSGIEARRVLGWVGLVALALVVFVFVATAVPQLVGADHSYVVQSSSMSPSISAGSVVFVEDASPESISEGDVITFSRTVDGRTDRITHRVVDVRRNDGQPYFQTKGDANEEPDAELAPARQVVGTVSFDVPLVGYVVSFLQTGTGIVTLIVVPAIVLLVLEARDLLAGTSHDDEEGGTG